MFRKLLAVLTAICLLGAYACAEAFDSFSWIEINDVDGLLAIAENPNAHYRLTADIDCRDIEWKPIPFSGELDGNGFAILNLTITEPGADRFTSIDANKKHYDTVGAGLFSIANNASIRNLSLLGLGINVNTGENCFCGGIAGAAMYTKIENCTVNGRVWLRQTGRNSGVAGVVGYAYAYVSNCNVDVELVYVDKNTEETCEEFAGGVLACGLVSILNCDVTSTLYCSVHGYCHNGGLIGMFWQGALGTQKCGIKETNVSFKVYFFEDTPSRRAYNEPYIGERFSRGMDIFRTTKTVLFEVHETKNYSTDIYPCTCRTQYTQEIIEPTIDAYGYTIYTCPTCGYTIRRDYTPRSVF